MQLFETDAKSSKVQPCLMSYLLDRQVYVGVKDATFFLDHLAS